MGDTEMKLNNKIIKSAIAVTAVMSVATIGYNVQKNMIIKSELLNYNKEVSKTESYKLELMKSSELDAKKRLQTELSIIMSPKFKPDDLTYKSNLTYDQLYAILKGSNLEDLTDAFIDAEKEYGVNALGLAGLVAVESGWNSSDRSEYQNNLTGYAVYSDSSEGKYFESKYDCVMHTAKLLKEDYLNPKGQWHTGYSIDSVNTNYSSDDDWSSKITTIASKLNKEYFKLFVDNNEDITRKEKILANLS